MPNSSNCEDDNVVELLDWSCFDELNDNELSSNMVEEDSLLIDETYKLNDIPLTFSTDVIEMNSLYYITGYIARKMSQKHADCLHCTNLLVSQTGTDTNTVFLRHKPFENITDVDSILISPSNTLLEQCGACQDVFENIFPSIYYKLAVLAGKLAGILFT